MTAPSHYNAHVLYDHEGAAIGAVFLAPGFIPRAVSHDGRCFEASDPTSATTSYQLIPATIVPAGHIVFNR